MRAQTDGKALRETDFPGWGGELEPVPELAFSVRALKCWMGFFPLNWLVWTLTGHWTLWTKAGKLPASFQWSLLVGKSKVPLNSPLRWEKSQLVFVLGRKKKLDTGYHQCLSGKINLPRSSVLGLLTGESGWLWAPWKDGLQGKQWGTRFLLTKAHCELLHTHTYFSRRYDAAALASHVPHLYD